MNFHNIGLLYIKKKPQTPISCHFEGELKKEDFQKCVDYPGGYWAWLKEYDKQFYERQQMGIEDQKSIFSWWENPYDPRLLEHNKRMNAIKEVHKIDIIDLQTELTGKAFNPDWKLIEKDLAKQGRHIYDYRMDLLANVKKHREQVKKDYDAFLGDFSSGSYKPKAFSNHFVGDVLPYGRNPIPKNIFVDMNKNYQKVKESKSQAAEHKTFLGDWLLKKLKSFFNFNEGDNLINFFYKLISYWVSFMPEVLNTILEIIKGWF